MQAHNFENKVDLQMQVAWLEGQLKFKNQEIKRLESKNEQLRLRNLDPNYLITNIDKVKKDLTFENHGEDLYFLLAEACLNSSSNPNIDNISSFEKVSDKILSYGDLFKNLLKLENDVVGAMSDIEDFYY
jgi:hypothetical protein